MPGRDESSRTVPTRDVRSVAVDMTEAERRLYDEVREFVRACYGGRAGLPRQALGFVMTHFRLRLGSSLHAFRKSLEDLSDRMAEERPQEVQWSDLPIGDDDSFSDVDPETKIPNPEFNSESRQALADLLVRCRDQIGQDSKFNALLRQLEGLREDGYMRVMVFSQFRDTQVWLREQLADEPMELLIAGLSGAGDSSCTYLSTVHLLNDHMRDFDISSSGISKKASWSVPRPQRVIY